MSKIDFKRIAIIPAKSFSRRLKNKNTKNFFGEPIIQYTIKNLIKSKLFCKIHISTDSMKIAKIGIKNNIPHDFLRTKRLCNNKTGVIEVIGWIIKQFKKKNINFDTICLAYPMAPLINKNDFIKACKLFEKSKKKFPLAAVCKFKPSIDEALVLKKGILFPNDKSFFKDSKITRTIILKQEILSFFLVNFLKKNIKKMI
jgi:CMP-N-acetylneuraminic acid synthetase